jgi:hypothetical protein
MNKLLYNKPASLWEEALPIGSGRLGAMIYGGDKSEQIQLNEITLWSGEPFLQADRQDAYKYLPQLRELIENREYEAAGTMMNERFTNFGGGFDAAYSCSYTTLGDLYFDIHGKDIEITDYKRSLDLESAVASVSYRADGILYTREFFASSPDNVMVYKFSCEKPGGLNLRIRAERSFSEFTATGDELRFFGTADGIEGHMRFDARLKVKLTGGSVSADGAFLTIQNADNAIIYFAARTDYVLDQSRNFKGCDPAPQTEKDIEKAYAKEYNLLKQAHIADYRALYAKNTLHFGEIEKAETDTSERLIRFKEGQPDPGLIELFYQFGRYLLICSSRPDNVLPANLQGIWCRDYEAPWHCDYHANINVQMNYWPAGPTNLAHNTRPLANLIEALRQNGEKTAKAYYGCEGWTIYTITSPWLWTSPGWSGGWAQYPLGGAWMCQHLFEYYAFTGDTALLEEFYPYVKANCLFNIGLLYHDKDGCYITCPATSPENSFRDEEGMTGWVCKGTTMNIEMLHENFTWMIKVCNLLNRDFELRDRLTVLRAALRPLQIGKAGQLCEWEGDWDLNAPELHHRHCSHLYGLHPGSMITPQGTPELAEAAKKSLDLRGDDGTGWSLAWKINFWARLGDGNRAFKLLKMMLRTVKGQEFNYSGGGGVYPNLFCAHPPFQIDGNFGATAGIAEMLLQSHVETKEGLYRIDLLPALPDELPSGEAKGLVARGGTEVDITWAQNKLTGAVLRPTKNGKLAVKGEFAPAFPHKYSMGVTEFYAEKGIEYKLL